MIALAISVIKLFNKNHTQQPEPAPAQAEYFWSTMHREWFHISELEFAGYCGGVARYHVVDEFGDWSIAVYEDELIAA